jgi:dTDP-glucose 4,6-dehydratase
MKFLAACNRMRVASVKPHPTGRNSPYSASKAASDHLARCYYETFGLQTIVTNCSNNYGPYQHAEKLIPTVLNSFLEGRKIPGIR